MADLKSLTNIRTTEDLINAVSTLYFNLNEIERTYYDVFINPSPMDVPLQRYNDVGTLETIMVPNRAKAVQSSLTGNGNPEGVVSAGAGTHYLDLITSNLYYKAAGSDSYGWVAIWSSLSLTEGVNFLAPNGDGSKLTNLNMNNVSSGVLSVGRGGTGSNTLEGLVKSNGSEPMTSAVDGEDYIGPASMTGVICYYPINNIPAGWLLCNGAEYSRETYARLFESLKVYNADGSFDLPYGAGDNLTTFNVPNLMGDPEDTRNPNSCYVRCWDGNSNFNELQYDEVKNHTHTFSGSTATEDQHTHTRGTMNITGSINGGLIDCEEEIKGAFETKLDSQYGKGVIGANSCTVDFKASRSWTGETSGGSAHLHQFEGTTNNNTGSQENRVLSKMLVPIIKY